MESTSFRTFPLGSSTTKLCSTVPLFTTLKVTSPAATLTSLGAHLNSVAVSATGAGAGGRAPPVGRRLDRRACACHSHLTSGFELPPVSVHARRPGCTPQGHSGGEGADPRGAAFSPEAYSGSVRTLTGASGPSSMREKWITVT